MLFKSRNPAPRRDHRSTRFARDCGIAWAYLTCLPAVASYSASYRHYTVRFELQLFGALIAPFFDCCPGREDLKTSSKVCNPPWTPTLTSNLPAVGGLHVGVLTPHLQLSVARAVSLASTGPATRLRGLRIMIALQVTPRSTASTRLPATVRRSWYPLLGHLLPDFSSAPFTTREHCRPTSLPQYRPSSACDTLCHSCPVLGLFLLRV